MRYHIDIQDCGSLWLTPRCWSKFLKNGSSIKAGRFVKCWPPFYERVVWAIVVAPLLLHSTQKFFNEWHPGFNGGRRARENKDRWEGGVVLSLTSVQQFKDQLRSSQLNKMSQSFKSKALKNTFYSLNKKHNSFKSRRVLANYPQKLHF